MPTTDGATKSHVELPILRCLASGDWKQAGEIKGFVARYGELPSSARRSLRNRSAEAQSNNAVQNYISRSRAGSLAVQGLIEYDAFKQAYRIVPRGRKRLGELESLKITLDEIFAEE